MTGPKDFFFKKGDTSLGTFYPTHYIVAGYHNMADAKAAAMACEKAGFTNEDVRVFEGDFVMKQLVSDEEEANWFERVQRALVRFVGTEADYLRQDADLAQAGGAFLLVYAPDDEARDKAKRVFAQHGPVYARRYLKIAIEIMVSSANAE